MANLIVVANFTVAECTDGGRYRNDAGPIWNAIWVEPVTLGPRSVLNDQFALLFYLDSVPTVTNKQVIELFTGYPTCN